MHFRLFLTDHSRLPLAEGLLAGLEARAGEELAIEYWHDPSNPGYGAGNNHAFQRAGKADFFLVANPDLEFMPDSLLAGLAFFAAHPDVGVIAPALIENDGNVRPACFRPPDILTLAMRGLGYTASNSSRIARYECRDWEPETPVFNPPLMSGCCLFFQADAFFRLGGFDAAYFLYFEDFDLSRRAARLGISAYCPWMRVRHAGGGAAAKGWRHWWWYLRSGWRYYRQAGR
ncbi:MAG: hypothetical protein N2441_06360 [Rhodocyclaceae bacterium]|nr:hypothetical protein [Rhodocyclaceae bacterium]